LILKSAREKSKRKGRHESHESGGMIHAQARQRW
jgi:hypothetical protein